MIHTNLSIYTPVYVNILAAQYTYIYKEYIFIIG